MHPYLGELTLYNYDGGCQAWVANLEISTGRLIRYRIWASQQAKEGEDEFIDSGASYFRWARDNEQRVFKHALDLVLSGNFKSHLTNSMTMPESATADDFRLLKLTHYPTQEIAEWCFGGIGDLLGCHLTFDQDGKDTISGTASFRRPCVVEQAREFWDRKNAFSTATQITPCDQILWTFIFREGCLAMDEELVALIDTCDADACLQMKHSTGPELDYFRELSSILRGIRS